MVFGCYRCCDYQEVLYFDSSSRTRNRFRGVRYNLLARRVKSVLERRPSAPEKVAGKGEVVRLPPRIGLTSEVSVPPTGIATTPTIDRHQASSCQHDEFYVLDVTH